MAAQSKTLLFKRGWYDRITPVKDLYEATRLVEAQWDRPVVNRAGVSTSGEPVMRPHVAAYGMTWPGGSMDLDGYFLRVTHNPVPLSAVEGRLGLDPYFASYELSIQHELQSTLGANALRPLVYIYAGEEEGPNNIDSAKYKLACRLKNRLARRSCHEGVDSFGLIESVIAGAAAAQDSAWALFYCEFYRLINFMSSNPASLLPCDGGFQWATDGTGARHVVGEDPDAMSSQFLEMRLAVIAMIRAVLRCTPSITRPVGAQHMLIPMIQMMGTALWTCVRQLTRSDGFLPGCSETDSSDPPLPARHGVSPRCMGWFKVRDIVITLRRLHTQALLTTLRLLNAASERVTGQGNFELSQERDILSLVARFSMRTRKMSVERVLNLVATSWDSETLQNAMREDPIHFGDRLRMGDIILRLKERGTLALGYKPYDLRVMASALSWHTGVQTEHYLPPVSLYHRRAEIFKKTGGTVEGAHMQWLTSLGPTMEPVMARLLGRQEAEICRRGGLYPDAVKRVSISYENPMLSALVTRWAMGGTSGECLATCIDKASDHHCALIRDGGMTDLHCTRADFDRVFTWEPSSSQGEEIRDNEVLRATTLNYYRFDMRASMINPVYTMPGMEFSAARRLVFWARRCLLRHRIAARTVVAPPTFAPRTKKTKKTKKKKKKTRMRRPEVAKKPAPVPAKPSQVSPAPTEPVPVLAKAVQVAPPETPLVAMPVSGVEPTTVDAPPPVKAQQPPASNEILEEVEALRRERRRFKAMVDAWGGRNSDADAANKQWQVVSAAFVAEGIPAYHARHVMPRVKAKAVASLVPAGLKRFRAIHDARSLWKLVAQTAICQAAQFAESTGLGIPTPETVGPPATESPPPASPPAEPEKPEVAQASVPPEPLGAPQPIQVGQPLIPIMRQLEYFMIHNIANDVYLQQFLGPHGIAPFEVLASFGTLQHLAALIGAHPVVAMIDAARLSPLLLVWTTGISAAPVRIG